MIPDLFIDLGVAVGTWFLGLFPSDFEAPEWISGLAGLVNEVFANAVGMGAWVPWPFVLLVVGSIVTVWLIGLFVKFVRWLIGIIPTMGGG